MLLIGDLWKKSLHIRHYGDIHDTITLHGQNGIGKRKE